MRFHTEIKKKTNEIMITLSGLKTEEKLTQEVVRQILESRQQQEELEIELESLENEISRINLDKLNTENQIFSLKDQLGQQEKKKKEKEDQVNKYEIIIKENIEAHERKMNEIGKFNKEHDKAMQKVTLVGTGPTENQLN